MLTMADSIWGFNLNFGQYLDYRLHVQPYENDSLLLLLAKVPGPSDGSWWSGYVHPQAEC